MNSLHGWTIENILSLVRTFAINNSRVGVVSLEDLLKKLDEIERETIITNRG
jgi:hypothetical protein